jgi:diacylglycerol kinase family enzyme
LLQFWKRADLDRGPQPVGAAPLPHFAFGTTLALHYSIYREYAVAGILIVINPGTSAGDPGAVAIAARRQLVGHTVHVFVPQSPSEYSDLGAAVAKLKSNFIVVVGGDGTTNLLLEELIKARLPVYFFAGGTANDLAKELGHVPAWSDVREAVDLCNVGELDVLKINERLFVTVGGFGIGAILTKMMNDYRSASLVFKSVTRIVSKYTYSILALQVITGLLYEPKYFEIVIDGNSELFHSACILIANQPFLGGDIQVSAEASNCDGIGNLLVLTDTSRLGLLSALSNMLRGKVPQKSVSRSFSSLVVRVPDNSPTLFFGDGESLCSDKVFQIEVIPKVLNVLKSRRQA